MKKKVFGRKLSRSRPAREALFASLSRSLILNGRIETTKAKAKAVVGSVEKMVTLAKKGGISERRNVLSQLDNSKDAADKLFGSIVKAFTGKNSGFIRTISLPRRHGDNAEMVRLEWTERIEEKHQEIKKEEKKAVKKEETKPVKKSVKKEVKSKK